MTLNAPGFKFSFDLLTILQRGLKLAPYVKISADLAQTEMIHGF
jgi:hypothetical protein